MKNLPVTIITRKIFDKYDFNLKLLCRIPDIATYETKLIFSSMQSLIMYYMLMKSYFISLLSLSLTVSSVNYVVKHCSILWMCLCTKFMGKNWLYLSEKAALPVLTPQSVNFGFTDVIHQIYHSVNHLVLILKYNVYNSKVNNTFSFQSLKFSISQLKYI